MSNKLTQMAREILEIENDLPRRFDYNKSDNPKIDDFDVHIFEQMWGSTSLGFNGFGKQAMTNATTYVFVPVSCDQNCFVYFAGKYAYESPYSDAFKADLKHKKMAPVYKSNKYINEQGKNSNISTPAVKKESGRK